MTAYPQLTNRKIEYNSPSGFVNIGKYIPPFENNSTGFGFKGVIIEDFESGKIQCSECGKWFEQLPTHLHLTHNMTGFEYRQKFGLLQSTALKSKKLRLNQSKVMQKLRRKNPQNNYSFVKDNEYAANRKNKPKAVESRNKYGVCDLQLMERIIELRNELGKTPTLTQLRDRYGAVIMTNLALRFGSYVKLCKDMGFEPNISNHNPKYSREYFIDKIKSKDSTIRILTVNESRALYRYFPGGINELKIIAGVQNEKN